MTKRTSKANLIFGNVKGKVEYLYSKINTGEGKAKLANIRRGIGRNPGELPELWGLIFNSLPQELSGRGAASKSEWAVYTALTLYALHQQGNEKSMHSERISLGKAVAELVKKEGFESEERISKRLNLVVTSTSPEDLAYYLRGIVQLLKSEEIPLDYALLAEQIYKMNFEESSHDVALSWGRDFYYALHKMEDNTNNDSE